MMLLVFLYLKTDTIDTTTKNHENTIKLIIFVAQILDCVEKVDSVTVDYWRLTLFHMTLQLMVRKIVSTPSLILHEFFA